MRMWPIYAGVLFAWMSGVGAQTPTVDFDDAMKVSNHLAAFSRDAALAIAETSPDIPLFRKENGQSSPFGSLRDFYGTLFADGKILTSQRCVGLPDHVVACGLFPGLPGTDPKVGSNLIMYQLKDGKIISAELIVQKKKSHG